ncbi:hypothetical protein A9G35_00370 [Gilliamella sp. Choc5-1]|jgi:hypothetical protein|nr:hypothetical protein A9G35_00370 [Gilliamella apicola]
MDFNDINDVGVHIITPRAYELLQPLFDNSVEVLPLKSNDGTYFLLNIIWIGYTNSYNFFKG